MHNMHMRSCGDPAAIPPAAAAARHLPHRHACRHSSLLLQKHTRDLLGWAQIITPFHIYFNFKLIWQKREVWRLATNFFYFGNLGLDFFFHMFFLVKYSKSLEEGSFRNRPADFLWMLLFGGALLVGVAPWVNIQFLGSSLTFMMVRGGRRGVGAGGAAAGGKGWGVEHSWRCNLQAIPPLQYPSRQLCAIEGHICDSIDPTQGWTDRPRRIQLADASAHPVQAQPPGPGRPPRAAAPLAALLRLGCGPSGVTIEPAKPLQAPTHMRCQQPGGAAGDRQALAQQHAITSTPSNWPAVESPAAGRQDAIAAAQPPPQTGCSRRGVASAALSYLTIAFAGADRRATLNAPAARRRGARGRGAQLAAYPHSWVWVAGGSQDRAMSPCKACSTVL